MKEVPSYNEEYIKRFIWMKLNFMQEETEDIFTIAFMRKESKICSI